MLTKKKTTPAPSFEERLGAAHATADAAVSIVETIAVDLEQAASDKRAIVADIDAEVDKLYATIDSLCVLREEAEESEAENLAKANNIRSLLSA
jgi:hypothetical protein